MEFQEASYIITYFPRLMTNLEKKANAHHFSLLHLGKPEDYDNRNSYEMRVKFFEKLNRITTDPNVLILLQDGYNNFVMRTAERIKKETPKQYKVNRCAVCNFIARTPYAFQCRNCGNNWHNELVGKMQFEVSFRVTKRPYFWIVGELIEGKAEVGDKIDLTNFQLNLVKEIKQVESCLRSVDGVKKDLPSFGIEVNNEEKKLIMKYLTKSATSVYILGNSL